MISRTYDNTTKDNWMRVLYATPSLGISKSATSEMLYYDEPAIMQHLPVRRKGGKKEASKVVQEASNIAKFTEPVTLIELESGYLRPIFW